MNNIIQQFLQFRQNFSGNAQEQIQRMMNSGKITQEQYNHAVKQAQELQRILSRY